MSLVSIVLVLLNENNFHCANSQESLLCQQAIIIICDVKQTNKTNNVELLLKKKSTFRNFESPGFMLNLNKLNLRFITTDQITIKFTLQG